MRFALCTVLLMVASGASAQGLTPDPSPIALPSPRRGAPPPESKNSAAAPALFPPLPGEGRAPSESTEGGQGGEALSLADALARARANSPRLSQLAAQEAAAEAALRGAQAEKMPLVDLSAGYTRNSHVDEFRLTLPNGESRVLFPDIPNNYRLHAGASVPLWTGGRIESAVTGMVVERMQAQGRFAGPKLVLTGITGSTPGGGSIAGSGTVDFSGGKAGLDLRFDASRARLLDRDDIAATVTGPLAIRSSGDGGTISGKVVLNSGRFTLGRASAAASVPQLQVRNVGQNAEDLIELKQLQPWKLDVDVAGGELNVRGLGIDSRWTTDVSISGRVDAPRLTGRADLIRGEYEFAGRNFRLDRGIIRFRGESPPDPQLDIRAQAQVQGLDASILVGGTGLKPEITFASVPQLPQDELLSRLLFGTSITNLSAPEALQLASAVAALRSGSGNLDPINALRRAVGLDRLRILPADVATGQKTAVSAGKYITRKLFVEVITDGQGYSATRAEYQVTRWLSILSSVSTIGRTSANVRVSKDY